MDDIVSRNLLSRNKNYYGVWEYTGSTILWDSHIYLYNNQPKSIGGFYFSNKLPDDCWNSTISLDFDQKSNEAKSGIWITKNFGPEGYICGGPSVFTGLAILITSNNNTFKIDLHENQGKALKIQKVSFTKSIETKNKTLVFYLSLNNQTFNIKFENNNQKYDFATKKLNYSIKKYWFGLTGMSPNNTSALRVNSVQFSSNYSLNLPISIAKIEIPKITITNPTKNEVITAKLVFDKIDLFQKKIYDLSTLTYVSKLISRTVINATEVWQTRSMSMIKECPKLVDNLNKTLRTSYLMIEQVENEIHEELLDLIKDVQNVTAELYYSIMFDTDIDRNVGKHAQNPVGKGFMKILFYFAIIEVTIFVILALWKICASYCSL